MPAAEAAGSGLGQYRGAGAMRSVTQPFHGAKIAILLGDSLLVILRDDRADIPWPAHWDLPGGGREGDEGPLDCALRETEEELGLRLAASAVGWHRAYPRPEGQPGVTWFFVHDGQEVDIAGIRLGDEGQRWTLMPVAEYLAHPRAIPHLASRLRDYLAG